MIKIKYNNIEGVLNLETEEVLFYHFKYKNIVEAIKNLEYDIRRNKEEMEIFDNLLGDLIIK